MKTDKELHDLQNYLIPILARDEMARYCDMYLYYTYCEKKMNEQGLSANMNYILGSPAYRKKYNLSPFCSVERARRRIIRLIPDLAPDMESEFFRANLSLIYKRYARSKRKPKIESQGDEMYETN